MRVASCALVLACAAACGSGDDEPSATDASTDATTSTDAATDDATATDATATDATATDAAPPDAPAIDAATDATVDAAIDAIPATSDHHVHIQVSNTCVMSVSPSEITIPANQTAYFDWHNHSVDYAVDVWMSYGGGYLDLPTGATWDEPIGHCATPSVHDEYADISTACSSFRLLIHCN